MKVSRLRNKTAIGGLLMASACLVLSPFVNLGTAHASSPATYTTIAQRATSSTSNGSGATSITITKPSGVAQDDVLVAQIVVTGASSTTITAPSGWTQVRRDNTGSSIADTVYYHVAGASEGSNYTWNFNASKQASAGIAAFTGVNTASPIDASSGFYNSTGSTTMSAPTVTTTTPADELLFFGGLTTHDTVTAPTGMTSQWTTTTTSTTSYMANQLLSASGATGSKVGTAATSGFSNISQQVALKPIVITPATNVSFVQADALSPGNRLSSENISFASAVASGDLLVGWFAQYDATGQVSVSDNVNGAWTRGSSETFSNGSGDIALYYKLNSAAASGGLTITVSANSATYLPYAVSHYTGMSGTASLDKVAVASVPVSANSNHAVAGPTASAPAGELVFGGHVTGGIPDSFTVGTSQGINYVKRATNFDSGSAGVEDIMSSAAGTQNSDFTLSSNTDWYSVVATFTP